MKKRFAKLTAVYLATVIVVCGLFPLSSKAFSSNQINVDYKFGSHIHEANGGYACEREYSFDSDNKKEAVKQHTVTEKEVQYCECGKYKYVLGETQFTESHSFDENGTCFWCGYQRRIDFPFAIPFVACKKDVPVRAQATSKVETLYTLDKYEAVEIVAKYRSDNGNLWLVTSDGNYIYYENMALDWNELLLNSIMELKDADNQQVAFAWNEREDGIWDYKVYLGAEENYKVWYDNKFTTMSGEDIGNFHYGFMGKYVGFKDNILIAAGGVVQVLTSWSLEDCNLDTYCDSPEDTKVVKKGIKYYKEWNK